VVPLHRQMLQLGQLGHLRRYRPECGIRTVELHTVYHRFANKGR
jgi:hypothetical protein